MVVLCDLYWTHKANDGYRILEGIYVYILLPPFLEGGNSHYFIGVTGSCVFSMIYTGHIRLTVFTGY